MERGQLINGLKSKTWVERYRDAGEFTLVASASTGMRETLPIGSFISHVDTEEIMIVENHEIVDERDKETEIVITGRGFETYLENRIVGSNRYFPNNLGPPEYLLAANYSWVQAVAMVNEHILPASLIDDYDALPFVDVETSIAGTAVSEQRSIQRGDLYSRLVELLSIDDLGIKVRRPFGADVNTKLTIHVGTDRTDSVIFSYDTGEIETAEYLWSNKHLKNSALVSGKWVEVRVDSLADTEYNRRMMYIEATDIDEAFSEPPTSTDLMNAIVKMEQRGMMFLAAQREIALTRAEVSREANTAAYRSDFNVGDLITVHGDYNETSVMRVSEYVEIEDENGKSGYPTLTMG